MGALRRPVLAVPAVFLAVAFAYPLTRILVTGLGWDGGGVLTPFRELVGDSYYAGRLLFTFWQAALSTVLVLLIGLPSAYVFARHRFPGRSLLLAATTVPFMMPPIVIALGFIALVGPTGLVNSLLMGVFGLDNPPVRLLNTFAIILIAHVVYEYTIVVRLVSNLWGNLDPALPEAAALLGASPARVFMRVTLPLLFPAIAASAALVFLFTFTSFGVILILGGIDFSTLEVEIYTVTTKLFRPPLAAALAITQLVVTFGVLWSYVRLQDVAVTRFRLRANQPPQNVPTHGRGSLLRIGAIISVLLVLSPLVALLARSVTGPDGLSLEGYTGIFSNDRDAYFYVPPIVSIRNSLAFGVATVALALPLGVLAAYGLRRGRKWWRSPLDALYMLPLGISAVTLGLGYLVSLRVGPVDLRATWVPIVLAHTLVAYPFVLRVVISTLRAMMPQLREAAQVLGAGPLGVLTRVELPILSGSLVVGAIFAFAVSLGEFGATLMLNRPEYTTMPVAIFSYLGRPGESNLAQALAMSTILMAISGTGFLLMERARFRGWGEF